MRDLIARYLEHLADERVVSPHTLRAYGSDLSRFLSFLSQDFLGKEVREIRPAEVDSLAVRSFLAAQARDGVGKRSQAWSLSALRGLLRFGCREGILGSNPASPVRSPK